MNAISSCISKQGCLQLCRTISPSPEKGEEGEGEEEEGQEGEEEEGQEGVEEQRSPITCRRGYLYL